MAAHGADGKGQAELEARGRHHFAKLQNILSQLVYRCDIGVPREHESGAAGDEGAEKPAACAQPVEKDIGPLTKTELGRRLRRDRVVRSADAGRSRFGAPIGRKLAAIEPADPDQAEPERDERSDPRKPLEPRGVE